jgi:hypothetical protein
MYISIKPLGVFFAPGLEGLNGTKVAQGALRDLAVVELEIVVEGRGQFGGALEAGASEMVCEKERICRSNRV